MFCFFGLEACGILAPRPGIEPAPSALEGEVITTGPPGKSLSFNSKVFLTWMMCWQSEILLYIISMISNSQNHADSDMKNKTLLYAYIVQGSDSHPSSFK